MVFAPSGAGGRAQLRGVKFSYEQLHAPVRGAERFFIKAKFSFACQKRTRKAPATFEAREARIKGYSPLIIPKKMGSIQKIQVASLEDFLCSADFESLTRRAVRISLCFICCAADSGNMPFAIAPFP